MSRIGKKPIVLPQAVKVELKDGVVSVKGPKGSLSRPLVAGIEVEITDKAVNVKRTGDDKKTRSYHGLMRTLVSNMVDGVSKGFEKKLEIVGIGYRSELHGNKLVFHLGYSHPIDFPLPRRHICRSGKADPGDDQRHRQGTGGSDCRKGQRPQKAGPV